MQLMYASFRMHHLWSFASFIFLRAVAVGASNVSSPSLPLSLRAHRTKLLQAPGDPGDYGNFEAYSKKYHNSYYKNLAKGPPNAPEGPATSYDDPYHACIGCVRFNPMIHLEATPGGPPPNECRYGPCDFRDPQTQPWGGVLGGGGSEPDPENGWYLPAKPLVCFTLDGISWFDKCDSVLFDEAKSTYEVSTACEYREQLNVVGPFVGAAAPFMRIGEKRNHEKCAEVIKAGWTLYDDKNAFNSDLEALYGCCETVHQYFTCVGDRKDILTNDTAGLLALDNIVNNTVADFSLFCVPMYAYPTQEEFCGKFPTSDPCAGPFDGCEPCTNVGGAWCEFFDKPSTCGPPKDAYPWCITDPTMCPVPAPAPPAPPPPAPPPAGPAPPPPEPDWYWQIVRATRTTNVTDIAVPYWTSVEWKNWTGREGTGWQGDYYINNASQLVKQGKPILFGPWALKQKMMETKVPKQHKIRGAKMHKQWEEVHLSTNHGGLR